MLLEAHADARTSKAYGSRDGERRTAERRAAEVEAADAGTLEGSEARQAV